MLQYIYSPQELGFAEWGSGTLRLEGIDVTQNADVADVFVCPGSLAMFRNPSSMNRFPYMEGRENRHVFFDCSDETADYNKPCIYLLCNLRPFMLASNPNALQIPWPVEDYESCCQPPEGGLIWDVSFRGWMSTDTRLQSSNACKNNPDLKCDIEQYQDFTGYLHDRSTGLWTEEGLRRRAEFRRSMKESRIALCPESIEGVLPYRFFEAMSAGRIPLLVSSDYVLPFADEIPYSDFVLFCERDNAVDADKVALGFIRNHTDTEIIDRGKLARQWWNARLDCRRWPEIMGMAVRRKMKALGLTTE